MEKQPPKYTGAWYWHMARKIEIARVNVHHARLQVDQDYRSRWQNQILFFLGLPVFSILLKRRAKN